MKGDCFKRLIELKEVNLIDDQVVDTSCGNITGRGLISQQLTGERRILLTQNVKKKEGANEAPSHLIISSCGFWSSVSFQFQYKSPSPEGRVGE